MTHTMNSLEQATERFAKLPIGFQEAIKNFDYDHKLAEIHRKYKLHIDQSFALEKSVADLIFGDIKSSDLVTKLKHDLHTTHEQAEQIAFEINDHILLPIREKIKGE